MNESKKLMALLCAFILVFSTVMTGCAKKVTFKDDKSTTNGKIKIGEGYEDIPEDAEIVVGEDGQSYIVDSEGNSIVYDAPSAYVVNNGTPANSTSFTTGTTTTTKKSTTTIKTITSTTTTESTTSQQDGVIAALIPVRKQAAYEAESLAKYSKDVLRIKFDDAEENWLVEFHKGMYGSETVGCEIGFYSRKDTDQAYGKITSAELIKDSASLFSGSSKIAAFDMSGVGIGWRYDFRKASQSYNPGSLAMVCTIGFHTATMANEFADSLDENGFREGSNIAGDPYEQANSYEFTDAQTVVLSWK